MESKAPDANANASGTWVLPLEKLQVDRATMEFLGQALSLTAGEDEDGHADGLGSSQRAIGQQWLDDAIEQFYRDAIQEWRRTSTAWEDALLPREEDFDDDGEGATGAIGATSVPDPVANPSPVKEQASPGSGTGDLAAPGTALRSSPQRIDDATPTFSARMSLDMFMRLRGRRNQGGAGHETSSQDEHTPCRPGLDGSGHVSDAGLGGGVAVTVDQPPVCRPPAQPLSLVVSDALLKTHLSLIRHLEQAEHQFHLTFREAGPLTSLDSGASAGHECEADITLAPRVGVVFTTLQEVMQVSLPGTQPSLGSRLPDCRRQALHRAIANAHSPLRMRLVQLAVRYTSLHVLVLAQQAKHGPTDTDNGHAMLASGTASTATVAAAATSSCIRLEEHTARALAALRAFCAQLAPTSQAKPVLVSLEGENGIVTEWLIALASDALRSSPDSVARNVQ